MYDGKGAVFVKGSSFGHFGEDGRLVQATGFFTTPPERQAGNPESGPFSIFGYG